MVIEVQRRRDGSSEHDSFTGAVGELTVDTDQNTIVVHDGGTAGGHELKQGSQSDGMLADIQYYTSAGATDWTKPSDLLFIEVHVYAGGGGGGGAQSDPGNNAEGGGGGAGGYSFKRILAASLGSTETVTVGGGGTAGADTGSNGGAGSTSSFGAHCTSLAGAGGVGDNGGTSGQNNHAGGAGGTASGGDINATGQSGMFGRVVANIRSTDACGGRAQGPFGGMGGGRSQPGNTFGGGGAGGDDSSGQEDAGEIGADGGVVVFEYY